MTLPQPANEFLKPRRLRQIVKYIAQTKLIPIIGGTMPPMIITISLPKSNQRIHIENPIVKKSILTIFFNYERFNNISLFKIAELFKSDTALIASGYLFDCVLESLERTHSVLKNYNAVTNNSDL